MLGVGLDDLVQRETTRRHRQLAWLAAGSLAGMAVTSTLAVTAIQGRDAAREQRREAEGLVGFMLGDLKDKLEPIGRLDALDAVGSRALAYYQHQDKSQLSDDALAQRSRALTLMGEIGYIRMEEIPGVFQLKESPQAVVYSPLGDAPLTPSVVLACGMPGRVMMLAEAAGRAGAKSSLPLLGRPTCMALPATWWKRSMDRSPMNSNGVMAPAKAMSTSTACSKSAAR